MGSVVWAAGGEVAGLPVDCHSSVTMEELPAWIVEPSLQVPPGTCFCIEITDHDAGACNLLYARHDEVPELVLEGSFDHKGDITCEKVQYRLEEDLVDRPVRVFRQLVVLHTERAHVSLFDLVSAHLGQVQPTAQFTGKSRLS